LLKMAKKKQMARLRLWRIWRVECLLVISMRRLRLQPIVTPTIIILLMVRNFSAFRMAFLSSDGSEVEGNDR
jgi:hypothetical protein